MGNQKSELFMLVKKSKERDKESIEKLCSKFDPLLKRYSYLLHNEEAYNELIIRFIKCIYNMPLERENFKLDKYILSYIKSSIKNGFNDLCSLNGIYKGIECFSINDDSFSEKSFEIPVSNDIDIEERLLFYDLKQILTEEEYEVVELKYLGYSDCFIAETIHVSRQAVNKRLHRLRCKIEFYFTQKEGA